MICFFEFGIPNIGIAVLAPVLGLLGNQHNPVRGYVERLYYNLLWISSILPSCRSYQRRARCVRRR